MQTQTTMGDCDKPNLFGEASYVERVLLRLSLIPKAYRTLIESLNQDEITVVVNRE
jgi:hypothetical protein